MKLLANPKTSIDSLYPIADAVTHLFPMGLAEGANIVTPRTPMGSIDPNGSYQTVLVIGVAEKVVPRDENEAIKVAQRGGVVKTGQTASLNLFMRDDSGEILCKIGYRNYDELEGAKWTEQTRAGKTIFAIKGSVPKDFRMVWVNRIKYLGELDRLPEIEVGNETPKEDERTAAGPASNRAKNAKSGSVAKRKSANGKSNKAKGPLLKQKKGPRQIVQRGKGKARSGAKGKARITPAKPLQRGATR